MSKKIFISGVAGFLGSHLADRMLERGHEVVGCDNMLGGYVENVPKSVEFHRADCRDIDKMKKLLRNVDVVYHCAAAPYEGLSAFSPSLIGQHTYGSTIALASAAISRDVKRFVFTSSMARYGKQKKTPFTEDMVPNPVDPYGIAKHMSELTLNTLCLLHGVEYVHAVPHNIIGPRQKYDDPYRNVASIMINLMLQGKQPVIYGDGKQKRSFSFVQDVIDPLEKLAFQKNVVREVINIGPDEETITINELAQNIAKLLSFSLKPVYTPGPPLEVKCASCSADKARRLLEYKTKYTLEEGLQKMIDWIGSRGTRPFVYHLPIEITKKKVPQTWKKRLF